MLSVYRLSPFICLSTNKDEKIKSCDFRKILAWKIWNNLENKCLRFQSDAHLIMGEGSPVYRATQRGDSPRSDKNSRISTMVAEGIKITADDLVRTDSQSGALKIRNPSVVPRKGAIPPSKIAARKGVGPESVAQTDSSVQNIDQAVSVLPTIDKAEKKKTDRSNGKNSTTDPKTLPDPATMAIPVVDKSASNSSHYSNKSVTSPTPVNVTPTGETNIQKLLTSPSSTTRKFKPKPTVTIGEMDIDKPIPASPTKTPPLGMPRKIDYIVPVIITIMALPLLGGAAFFLYRRGRDCWDKRHYRRMDFLIDGMYNDHTSWK